MNHPTERKHGWKPAHGLSLALSLLLVGCATTPPGQAPAFPKFRTAGEDRILLTAAGGGFLTQRGRCLGLADRSGGNFRTMIWPETANLTVDSSGLLLTDSQSGAAVRIGDYIAIGGGALPAGAAASLAGQLTEPVPGECAAAVGSVNPGFRRVSPPPSQ